jgi:acyl-CoA synthetase (AMP-forming)/AMP-acid ligase II
MPAGSVGFRALTRPPVSFVDVLRNRAEQQGDERIYNFLRGEDTESLSYGELDVRARSLAAHLSEMCAAGERALLLYPPGLDYIVALYACMYAGLIAVPAYLPRPNRPLSRLEAIVADAQPSIALTTREILNSPRSAFVRKEGALAQIRWSAADVPCAELPDSRMRCTAPDAAALLQYTSGSTASPRGVVLTQTNLLHNSEMIKQNFGLSSESVGVIWLPPYHDMGLIGGILQPLYVGLPVYLLSPTAFLQRPALWPQAISRFRGTCSGGPNFAYDLCVRRITEEEMDGLDLSSWMVAFTGAEPIRKETLDAFAATFARCGFRRPSLHPCYGLAEATLMVSGVTPGQGPSYLPVPRSALERGYIEPPKPGTEQEVILVSCGRPTGGQELRIVNPDTGAICRADEIGEIWVAGPSISCGYWQRPEETKETFCASLVHEERAFLRTGDLGFVRDGELYITGRIKDLIIIRGQNHYAHDIEFTAERSHTALKPSSSAAFSVSRDGSESLVIVQELDPSHSVEESQEVIANIIRAVSATHDLRVDEVVVVRRGSIPRTSSGKMQRYLCRAAYLAGSLAHAVPVEKPSS